MCPDTPSLSCWIQFMCHAVCFPVKCVIIPGLVDPHTPQDHRRMIPILLYHVFYVFDRLFFPVFIPDVLPARYFRKDQKSQFITPLHKMPALRIMGCPHRIYAQFIFQNICIQFLHGFRHCITDIRIALMAVQSSQLYFFAI